MDVVESLLAALGHESPAAPALAYGAGVLTSAGPCLAPRVAAIAGMAARVPAERRVQLHLCFVGGLASAYALIAASVVLLARLTAASPYVYALLAAALCAYGIKSVLDTRGDCHHELRASAAPSLGCAFVVGAGYALIVSPCCTPVIAAIATAGSMAPSPVLAASVALMFGFGHASPVLVGSLGVARLSGATRALAHRSELSVVSGAVMIALGGYYGILA